MAEFLTTATLLCSLAICIRLLTYRPAPAPTTAPPSPGARGC